MKKVSTRTREQERILTLATRRGEPSKDIKTLRLATPARIKTKAVRVNLCWRMDLVRSSEEIRTKWISIRMMREEFAHLLESVRSPYHSSIERSRVECLLKKKRRGTYVSRKLKVQRYYMDEWEQTKEGVEAAWPSG